MTDVVKIDKKIVAQKVVADKPETQAVIQPVPKVIKRPVVLPGKTYKIKSPLTTHALYVTINDIPVDDATNPTQYQPFEIFINSKDMNSFQWITALTRMISANFRKGGDVTFILEELESIMDPGTTGYIAKGGKQISSLVAEIGNTIRQHFKSIGLIQDAHLDVHMKKYLDDKKADYVATTNDSVDSNGFPESAVVCPECHHKAMILMDNCMTCLNCGNSKCG